MGGSWEGQSSSGKVLFKLREVLREEHELTATGLLMALQALVQLLHGV